MWRVLSAASRNSAIILTSHSMEAVQAKYIIITYRKFSNPNLSFDFIEHYTYTTYGVPTGIMFSYLHYGCREIEGLWDTQVLNATYIANSCKISYFI